MRAETSNASSISKQDKQTFSQPFHLLNNLYYAPNRKRKYLFIYFMHILLLEMTIEH